MGKLPLLYTYLRFKYDKDCKLKKRQIYCTGFLYGNCFSCLNEISCCQYDIQIASCTNVSRTCCYKKAKNMNQQFSPAKSTTWPCKSSKCYHLETIPSSHGQFSSVAQSNNNYLLYVSWSKHAASLVIGIRREILTYIEITSWKVRAYGFYSRVEKYWKTNE